MPHSMVIASGKGGVGKSTTAAALGRAFAARGKKVLLVDCDAGLSSLDVMLGLGRDNVFSWYDAYKEQCTPDEALIKANENLFLFRAPSEPIKEEAGDAVKKVTAGLSEDFDMIIRDAPAGLGAGLMRAVNGAEFAVVVATADAISVKDAAAVAQVIRKAGAQTARLVINRYDIKAAKNGKLLSVDELIDKSYVRLIGIVPEDKNIMYSTVTNKRNPKSKSSRAFERIADRIDGKNIELTLSLLK